MNLAEISELTENQARDLIESIRWPHGPVCPHCGDNERIVRIGGESARPGLLRCKACRKQFTVSVGTIFERSHIPLRKWLMAFSMMCSSAHAADAFLGLRKEHPAERRVDPREIGADGIEALHQRDVGSLPRRRARDGKIGIFRRHVASHFSPFRTFFIA